MHQALYRKWRPGSFDDVIGQDHITSVLKYEVTENKLSHAYLFSGSRGTGKTTCAKILAKAVNCEHPENGNPCGHCANCLSLEEGSSTDVVEMDAASNNGIENIRAIRDEVTYVPGMMKYRVYIIDEVHMLSTSAFNALLKTLEEPPAHVIFILATTELQKLPATVISRCQRFEFRRISNTNIVDRLMSIAKAEGIDLDERAAAQIARLSQGGMRDAISLLDLCSAGTHKVTVDLVNETTGCSSRTDLLALVEAVARRDGETVLAQVDTLVKSSKDLIVYWQELISFWRDMLVLQISSNAAEYLDLTDVEFEELKRVSGLFTREQLLAHAALLEDAYLNMQKANVIKRLTAEITLLKMTDPRLDTSVTSLMARISKIEERLKGGTPVVSMEVQKEAPVSEPVSAPAKPLQRQKQEPAVPSASAAKTIKPMREWPEILDTLSKSDITLASPLKGAQAFRKGEGGYLIRFRGAFGMDRLQAGDNLQKLLNAMRSVLSETITEQDVELALAESKDNQYAEQQSLFSELENH